MLAMLSSSPKVSLLQYCTAWNQHPNASAKFLLIHLTNLQLCCGLTPASNYTSHSRSLTPAPSRMGGTELEA